MGMIMEIVNEVAVEREILGSPDDGASMEFMDLVNAWKLVMVLEGIV